MMPAGLNLVMVCGLPWPACPVEVTPGNPCLFHHGHPPIQSPSGSHMPRIPVQGKKPDRIDDPLKMRA